MRPERSTVTRSCTSWMVKLPWITPWSVIRSWMVGAEITD